MNDHLLINLCSQETVMISSDIRMALKREPFEPFFLHLADGRKYEVKHPDFASVSPGGGTVLLYETIDKGRFINTSQISTVEPINFSEDI